MAMEGFYTRGAAGMSKRRTAAAVRLRSAPVIVGVDLDVTRPLLGKLVLGEARIDRAGLDARVAIDALLGVDVELRLVVVALLLLGGMDAIHRADLNAREILGADAGLGDDVGHGRAMLAAPVGATAASSHWAKRRLADALSSSERSPSSRRSTGNAPTPKVCSSDSS